MSAIDSLEHAVRQLSPEDLAAFRRWFLEFDAAAWDAQIEADARAGKLDAFAAERGRACVRSIARDSNREAMPPITLTSRAPPPDSTAVVICRSPSAWIASVEPARGQ